VLFSSSYLYPYFSQTRWTALANQPRKKLELLDNIILKQGRITLPADRWDSTCTKSIGGGTLLKKSMDECAP